MPAAVVMGQKAQKNFTVKWFIKGMWQIAGSVRLMERASGLCVGAACVADLPEG
jgi:hypothetical protein